MIFGPRGGGNKLCQGLFGGSWIVVGEGGGGVAAGGARMGERGGDDKLGPVDLCRGVTV